MDITLEIAGKKALPVWTIPYVTGRFISPDSLLKMLSEATCDDEWHAKFPSAFNLDSESNPQKLPPSQWVEVAGQIEKLECDLDEKKLPGLEDRKEWCKQSIELIMSYRAYLWLDELEHFFNSYKKRFEPDEPELCLNPMISAEHEEFFKKNELRLQDIFKANNDSVDIIDCVSYEMGFTFGGKCDPNWRETIGLPYAPATKLVYLINEPTHESREILALMLLGDSLDGRIPFVKDGETYLYRPRDFIDWALNARQLPIPNVIVRYLEEQQILHQECCGSVQKAIDLEKVAQERSTSKDIKKSPKISKFLQRLEFFTKWLDERKEKGESNDFNGYTVKNIHDLLMIDNNKLFRISLNSFDSHFWDKQKLIQLVPGRPKINN